MGGSERSTASGAVTAGSILVRRAEARDIPAILRIERSSFADPWSADAFINTLFRDRMRFLAAVDQSGVIEGGAGGPSVVGYVIALLLTDEAEIADLAVALAARGRGVGGLLLDEVTAEVAGEGARALFLEVRESNQAARALYESRSFKQVGRRKGY